MKGMIAAFWGSCLSILFLGSVGLQAKALCVSNSFANLRAGPSTQTEQTGRVFQYTPLEILSKDRNWYRVRDIEKRIHWIREDLVTRDYSCAQVKNDYANLRSGPGTSHPLVGAERADRLVPFRVLRQQELWLEVQDSEGDKMWVYQPLMWKP